MVIKIVVLFLLTALIVPGDALLAAGPSTTPRPVSTTTQRTLSTVPYAAPTDRVQAAAPGWTTVLREDFEGAWPSGLWTNLDNDAPPALFGEYCWRNVAFQPYRGTRSAWPAGGCANALDPSISSYPNRANSWMVYGPFSLVGASAAFVDAKAWTQIALPDAVVIAASTNGYNFNGLAFTGSTSSVEPPTSEGWADLYLDLTVVPGLGSLVGQPQVWVAVVFQSDFAITDNGPFVDDLRIEKRTVPASNVGGRNLRLSTGRPLAAGTALLTWEKGAVETGYLVVRWSPVSGNRFFPANLVPFSAATTSFTDPGPLPDEAYCYLVAAVGGNPPSVANVLELSDFLCVYPNTSSGTTAQNFAIDLRQSDVAGLSWSSVLESISFTRWEITSSTFDTSPSTTVPLDLSTLNYSAHTAGQATCYQLATSNGGTVVGRTNKLCAVPAISTLKQGTNPSDIVRQLLPPRR